MSKETKNSVAGGILVQGGILALAGIISRAIGLVRRIPLTNIIGDVGNGYYANAYEIYSIILLLSSYSLPVAISRLVAARTEKGQSKNTQKLFHGALLFAVISGGLSCILVLIFADFLATTVMGEPKSAMALRVLALFSGKGNHGGYRNFPDYRTDYSCCNIPCFCVPFLRNRYEIRKYYDG